MPVQRDSFERQQVAAVCYRTGARGVEFLLVQTRGGRWTFPKGGVEPGLTQAQSAALEAFEEAGVHGRIEEMPFARYRVGKMRGKTGKGWHGRTHADGSGEPVTAHLCEVSRLEMPQEANRRPTWFRPDKAKRRLREDRAAEIGHELAGVVDRAVARIRRLEAAARNDGQKDVLQTVRFEAFEGASLPGGREAAMIRYFLLGQRRLLASGAEAEDAGVSVQ